MKTSKEFDNVLDECLERVLVKGETIEQCLQSYPEQAAELEPLLQTALVAKKASAIQPRAEFKARARYQFHSALQEAASRRSRPLFGWFPQWATVVTIVLVLMLVGGGTVVAADNSMPDELLYPVKLETERVWLILTPSDIGKAQLCARLADRRVAEIIYMANKGDAQQVELIAQRLDKRLVMLAVLASAVQAEGVPEMLAPAPAEEAPPPAPPAPGKARGSRDVYALTDNRAKLRMTVAHYAANHPQALRTVLEKAPESAKPALRRAIAVSEAGYKRALEALD
ncbi:MAG: DUF5667 domain-containing protein [Dehalococcoidia bacterium]|nr:DUF5667 domain-containing protein [Dehalococcoidia bacterium]